MYFNYQLIFVIMKQAERDNNIKAIKDLLNKLPDKTFECNGKLLIVFEHFLDDEKITIDFDRIVMDCNYEKNFNTENPCQVWLDDLDENGHFCNTFTIDDLEDSEIEKVLSVLKTNI